MSTEISVRQPNAIVPRTIQDMQMLAGEMFRSGMLPKDFTSPEKVFIAILAGLEVGLPPFQACQSIAVINGRPTLWGDIVLGLVQGSGLLADFDETISGPENDLVATCRATRKDRPTPITRTFSQKDAVKAGLWGKTGPWSQYPKRMLQMRARSWVLRDGFPDVLRGMAVREEAEDMPVGNTVGLGVQIADAVMGDSQVIQGHVVVESDDDAEILKELISHASQGSAHMAEWWPSVPRKNKEVYKLNSDMLIGLKLAADDALKSATPATTPPQTLQPVTEPPAVGWNRAPVLGDAKLGDIVSVEGKNDNGEGYSFSGLIVDVTETIIRLGTATLADGTLLAGFGRSILINKLVAVKVLQPAAVAPANGGRVVME